MPVRLCTIQLESHVHSVKENVRKRPLDGPLGGLGRQGAVRKRKGEVHEMNGHKFVQKGFYQLMLCALCGDFLLNASGYQCEDCRYTCHKKCHVNVVTKCISKSNTGVSTYLSDGCIYTDIWTNRRTRRRSTIAFHTDSRLSQIFPRIGVVTVDTCCLLVAETHADVPNVGFHVMPTAHIWCQISAVCPTKPQTRC